MSEPPAVRPDGLRTPHPARLNPDSPGYELRLAAHDAALAADEPGYLDPIDGLFVFTAAYFVTRGTCCDNKCRHCPYFCGGSL